MINLLPETEKISIRKEYWQRFCAVVLGFVFAGTIIAFIFLTPSYFLSHYQNDSEQKAAANATNVAGGTQALGVLSAANALASALASTSSTTPPSDIIDRIVADRGSNTINSFSYSENIGSAPTMTIQGIATSRDSLLAMTQVLQNESLISAVDLPISDLALDTDIPFSIEITIKG